MGVLTFLHFVNNISSGDHLESGYYWSKDVKNMVIIPWKIEQNLVMNQIWATNYMSLIIPIILATQWKSNIKIWQFLSFCFPPFKQLQVFKIFFFFSKCLFFNFLIRLAFSILCFFSPILRTQVPTFFLLAIYN